MDGHEDNDLKIRIEVVYLPLQTMVMSTMTDVVERGVVCEWKERERVWIVTDEDAVS